MMDEYEWIIEDLRREREWREKSQREWEQRAAEASEQLRKDLEAMPARVKRIEEELVGRFHDLYWHLTFVYFVLFALFCAVVWLGFFR